VLPVTPNDDHGKAFSFSHRGLRRLRPFSGVVCTVNVHIVCLVQSVVHDDRQQERKPRWAVSGRQRDLRRSCERGVPRGSPRPGAIGTVAMIYAGVATVVGVRG